MNFDDVFRLQKNYLSNHGPSHCDRRSINRLNKRKYNINDWVIWRCNIWPRINQPRKWIIRGLIMHFVDFMISLSWVLCHFPSSRFVFCANKCNLNSKIFVIDFAYLYCRDTLIWRNFYFREHPFLIRTNGRTIKFFFFSKCWLCPTGLIVVSIVSVNWNPWLRE